MTKINLRRKINGGTVSYKASSQSQTIFGCLEKNGCAAAKEEPKKALLVEAEEE